MKNMELHIDESADNSSLKIYSSEVASQDKMIIRIKKQEQDVDIESKDSSMDHEEIVSYTCEFVQKDDESKSDINDLCDDSMESVRQDENFIYPAITNSDDEDINDVTWQPPSNILTPRERLARKNIKCLYPKVDKSLQKKQKCKNNKANRELTDKRMKKERLTKSKQILEVLNDSKPDVFNKTDEIDSCESITKKGCDSLIPKEKEKMNRGKSFSSNNLKKSKSKNKGNPSALSSPLSQDQQQKQDLEHLKCPYVTHDPNTGISSTRYFILKMNTNSSEDKNKNTTLKNEEPTKNKSIVIDKSKSFRASDSGSKTTSKPREKKNMGKKNADAEKFADAKTCEVTETALEEDTTLYQEASTSGNPSCDNKVDEVTASFRRLRFIETLVPGSSGNEEDNIVYTLAPPIKEGEEKPPKRRYLNLCYSVPDTSPTITDEEFKNSDTYKRYQEWVDAGVEMYLTGIPDDCYFAFSYE